MHAQAKPSKLSMCLARQWKKKKSRVVHMKWGQTTQKITIKQQQEAPVIKQQQQRSRF